MERKYSNNNDIRSELGKLSFIEKGDLEINENDKYIIFGKEFP